MKNIIFYSFYLIISLLSCQVKDKSFLLNGEIKGNYSGYLFLEYDKIIDSCLIKDKKFHFQGKVNRPTSAFLYAEGFSANDRNFYIENTEMIVNVSFEKRKIQKYELNHVSIDTVIGTKTSKLFYDFEKFKDQNSMKSNWNEMFYSKLSDIFTKNPNSDYAESILKESTFDTILKPQQLKDLYEKLDIKNRDARDNRRLERIIFPERFLNVGDAIKDFELPNQLDSIVNTKDFRGTYLLIDFWASWCKPCRELFPELKQIATKYKEEGFRVLGVSIDDDKEKWINAIKTDSLIWVNVIDGGALNDDVENEYGIFSVPSNLLIDPKGKIVKKNISLDKLETKLREI
ncbi:TlpA disulfide reductase family protein [Aequorivita capsosiphonis]|uniref:TlpA disulfide reductase family protein n=1 Tax=Aequorivita capsosiphonis TaxID=487317 RepID=UPI0004791F83|nr:TlpA disulfide reductase family protein [Aequorivita capsosiphonis]